MERKRENIFLRMKPNEVIISFRHKNGTEELQEAGQGHSTNDDFEKRPIHVP